MKRRQSISELKGNAAAIIEKLTVMSHFERRAQSDVVLWLAIEREAQRILEEARERAREHEQEAH